MLKKLLKQFNVPEIELIRLENRYFRKPDQTLLKFQPIYSGEIIAIQRGDRILPSIGFLQELAKMNKKVTVNKKGEWLMICGRDIFGKCIIKHENSKPNETVFVMNESQECIGYGTVANITSKKVAVKRIFDLGDLLRRER